MADNMDYSNLTIEQLLAEEKKLKKNEIYRGLAVGFLIGIIIFGFIKKGFGFLYMFISIILIVAINRESKKQKELLKQVQAEIKNR